MFTYIYINKIKDGYIHKYFILKLKIHRLKMLEFFKQHQLFNSSSLHRRPRPTRTPSAERYST